jgi:hypothetical protein
LGPDDPAPDEVVCGACQQPCTIDDDAQDV